MLVLTRLEKQVIEITDPSTGHVIRVSVERVIGKDKVRLGVEAPAWWKINRLEALEKKREGGKCAKEGK